MCHEQALSSLTRGAAQNEAHHAHTHRAATIPATACAARLPPQPGCAHMQGARQAILADGATSGRPARLQKVHKVHKVHAASRPEKSRHEWRWWCARAPAQADSLHRPGQQHGRPHRLDREGVQRDGRARHPSAPHQQPVGDGAHVRARPGEIRQRRLRGSSVASVRTCHD